jgi:hypothetical protein
MKRRIPIARGKAVKKKEKTEKVCESRGIES